MLHRAFLNAGRERRANPIIRNFLIERAEYLGGCADGGLTSNIAQAQFTHTIGR